MLKMSLTKWNNTDQQHCYTIYFHSYQYTRRKIYCLTLPCWFYRILIVICLFIVKKAINDFTLILSTSFFFLPFQREKTKRNTLRWTHFPVSSKACGSRLSKFKFYAHSDDLHMCILLIDNLQYKKIECIKIYSIY